MKHIIMCKCGKLAIKCKEASEGLNDLVVNAKTEQFNELKKKHLGSQKEAMTKQ